MRKFQIVLLTALLVGCDDDDAQLDGRVDSGGASSDGGPGDASVVDAPATPVVDAPGDAAAQAVDAPGDTGQGDALVAITGGALLVTKSPPGNTTMANWDGVFLFHIPETGAQPMAEADIDKSLVRDPVGLAFRPAASEVLVGNRHGNTAADGTAGSVSRFIYNPATRAFTPSGTITGNGLSGVHQVFIAPNGELFAANRDAGVSRFTFGAGGNAVANGTIGNGPARGVAVSPNGQSVYMTGASNSIRHFRLSTGEELPATTVATSANFHYLAIRRGQLYAAALNDHKVYRYNIDANNDLIPVDSVNAPGAIAVAFSEDEREMFVSGHRDTDVVSRFGHDAVDDAWVHTGEIRAGASLGGVVMLPIR